jgi:hypothetical protein
MTLTYGGLHSSPQTAHAAESGRSDPRKCFPRRRSTGDGHAGGTGGDGQGAKGGEIGGSEGAKDSNEAERSRKRD